MLADDDDVSRRRLGRLPSGWTVEFVDDRSGPTEAWRDHARPVVVNDDLVLRPAWLTDCRASEGRTVVDIEPGGAFGLGDHPTTRLSADAVWRLTPAGASVLDVGSGSGVLAIVALMRGAHVVGALRALDHMATRVDAAWACLELLKPRP